MDLPLTFDTAVRLVSEQDRTLADRLLQWATLGARATVEPWGALLEAGRSLPDLKHDVIALAGGAALPPGSGRSPRPGRRDVLLAAHSLVVLSSFFEALTERLGAYDRSMGLSDREKAALAAGRPPADVTMAALLADVAPYPAPDKSIENLTAECAEYYRQLGRRTGRFVQGLAFWDRIHDSQRDQVVQDVSRSVPLVALDRYSANLVRLCAEAPEFLVWMQFQQQSLLLSRIDRAWQGVEASALVDALSRLEAGMGATQRALEVLEGDRSRRTTGTLAELHEANRRNRDTPLVPTRELSGLRVVVPSLGDAYQSPSFRVAQHESDSREADDSWWAERDVRQDFEPFVVGYLRHSISTRNPLLVLGRPGSGKSAWTKVCAAALEPGGLVGLRVVLRDVSPELTIQQQVEFQLRETLGRTVDWADFRREAGVAMPVIFFDGLDEYLLVTGRDEVDYLDRLQEFQEKWADAGLPLVAVVTSRTVVASRATIPHGSYVVRLEPFEESQVTAWVDVWNQCNTAGAADEGQPTLPLAAVLRQGALAREPILLLMLALLNAQDGLLRITDDAMTRAALYERLLGSFLVREAGRAERRTAGAAQVVAERRFAQLGIASMGMHNRGRQGILRSELAEDLAYFDVGSSGSDRAVSGAAPVIALVETFFFIHESRSPTLDVPGFTSTTGEKYYEFVHPTFSEFLMARLLITVLSQAADEDSAPGAPDRLEQLLSFSCISSRPEVLAFLGELAHGHVVSADLGRIVDWLRARLISVMTEGLRASDARAYARHRSGLLERLASFSANLLCVSVELAGEMPVASLAPEGETLEWWRRSASLWEAHLHRAEWVALAERYQVERDHEALTVQPRPRTSAPLSVHLEIDRLCAEFRQDLDHARLLELPIRLVGGPAQLLAAALLSDSPEEREVAHLLVVLSAAGPRNPREFSEALSRLRSAALRTGLLEPILQHLG